MRLIPILLALLISMHCSVAALASQPLAYIFRNGHEGYRMYRIPAVTVMPDGRILAFAEGRQSLFDNGKIDIVMKSSADSGRTWGPLRVVWSHPSGTCGNPAPVVDRKTGNVILVCTYNNTNVACLSSPDNGVTWSAPKDITSMVKPATWGWYATGPGHSIQMQSGRLVIPCNHTVSGTQGHVAHVLLSDDHGLSWRIGGSVSCAYSDESTVAEVRPGLLLMNMRNENRIKPYRRVAYSTDGGEHWQECKFDTALVEPVCQGSLCHIGRPPGALLFCNPAHPTRRRNLTLHVSYDQGNTWRRSVVLRSGPSAYSDLAELPGGNILCIYEAGRVSPYGGIAVCSISAAEVCQP